MQENFKIFGLGLSKTGTSSLGEALNYLGIKTIHYPFDDDTYDKLYHGRYDLDILKDMYRGIVDIPAAPFYAQWDRQYPGSKFILTVRDRGAWVKSAEKHWELMMQWWKEFPQFRRFQEFISAAVYGSVGFNAERFLFAYDAHVRQVREYFKDRPGDFIEMDVCAGEGWEKLCPFLGLPQPATPFPHANEWMHKLMEATGDLRSVVPKGSSFVLIDYEGFGEDFSAGYRRIPFLEKDGGYWGPPADDTEALAGLERIISAYQPEYVVIGWPAFWWYEYYAAFTADLERRFTCVSSNDKLKIYKI